MNIIFLLCSLVVHGGCYANRQQENFLQAQHCAENKKYQEAIVLYDTLSNPSTVVLYNKGICFYQLGKYPEAFVAFLNALRQADKKQYDFAYRALHQVADKAGYLVEYSWKDTIRLLNLYIPILALQILFLLTLFFSVWFCSTRSFLLKRLAVACFCCLQAGYLAAVWYKDQCKDGIIIISTKVHAGPGKEYKAQASFQVGSVVSVDKKEKSWYKVKGVNVSGWIEETALSMIEE